MRWLDGITDVINMNLNSSQDGEGQEAGGMQSMGRRVILTGWLNNNNNIYGYIYQQYGYKHPALYVEFKCAQQSHTRRQCGVIESNGMGWVLESHRDQFKSHFYLGKSNSPSGVKYFFKKLFFFEKIEFWFK